MTADPICRWPPVYDFESLGEEIDRNVEDNTIFDLFFHKRGLGSNLFQGDILKYPGVFPFIDKDGNVQIFEEDYDYWMILGNSCDLSREHESTHLSHISPLIPLDNETPGEIVNGLRTYNSYKKFYIPTWDTSIAPGFVLYFSNICSVEKKSLVNHSDIISRLTFKSWWLFHSCLVRYLARDDGRHD